MNQQIKPSAVERATMLMTAIVIVSEVLIFLISGGFNVNSKLSSIDSEIKSLKQEIQLINQIQDRRLDRLESSVKSR
jgi:cell division protein FtsL